MYLVIKKSTPKGECPIIVSVMIPTRGRPDKLIRAVQSLQSNAKDIDRIEIILRVDEDDKATLAMLNSTPLGVKALVGSRKEGYFSLHEHILDMARVAKGRWLMSFNDDCVMKTKDWEKQLDVVIVWGNEIEFQKDGDEGALWIDDFWLINPQIEHLPGYHPGHFVVSRELATLLDRMGGNLGVDTWMHSIFRHIDRICYNSFGITYAHPNDMSHMEDKTTEEGRDRVFKSAEWQYKLCDSPDVSIERLTDATKLMKQIKHLRDNNIGRMDGKRTPYGLQIDWQGRKGVVDVLWENSR